MSELSRTSALASRHIELGSGLEDWNGMGTAWSYHSDPNDEHDAIRQAAGISIDHDDALVGGELLKLDGAEVGVINSPCWSHRLNKSLALVHLRPTASQPGTRLEVSGDNFSGTATVEATPFFDAGKSRTHA